MLLTIQEKNLNGFLFMRILIISDTHFGHKALKKRIGSRPSNFEEMIIRNWNRMVAPEDMIIHLGDLFIGNQSIWLETAAKLNGNKILVKGNHDERSYSWYMNKGFNFCCESFTWNLFGYNIMFTHKPVAEGDFDINIHGHLHDGRHRDMTTDERHILISLEKNGYQPQLLNTLVRKWVMQ